MDTDINTLIKNAVNKTLYPNRSMCFAEDTKVPFKEDVKPSPEIVKLIEGIRLSPQDLERFFGHKQSK